MRPHHGREGVMRVFRRNVLFVACVTGILIASTASATQSLLIGPALQSSSSPVEPGAPAATPADKRTQNTEQLRLAQRKLETNGAADKAAALEVAFYQTRDAILAQKEAVAHQIKDLTARKRK